MASLIHGQIPNFDCISIIILQRWKVFEKTMLPNIMKKDKENHSINTDT